MNLEEEDKERKLGKIYGRTYLTAIIVYAVIAYVFITGQNIKDTLSFTGLFALLYFMASKLVEDFSKK